MAEPLPVVVVGIGADGWDGLSPAARRAIENAEVLMGSARQLALIKTYAERVAWPSPLLPALPGLLAEYGDRRICVLASGDPMFHGIGSTLVRLLGPESVRVLPSPSSVSLACARMGWPVERVQVVSLVGRPLATLNAVLRPGERLLVLGATDPGRVADLLVDRGYSQSSFTVLELLGSPREHVRHTTATGWSVWGDSPDPLNIVAIECVPDPGTLTLPRVPGLPDDVFDHDGQLTKREIRAVVLGLLGTDGHLWDIGAGSGGIAIEWLRAHPTGTAIAVERDPDRAARITRNAESLGTPSLRVLAGNAPAALANLTNPPTTIFIGGGLTTPGLLDHCWSALRPGGRLVATAVTLESESLLTTWYGRLGGDLLRLTVNRAAPLGGFTTWRPQLPVTIWSVTKLAADRE